MLISLRRHMPTSHAVRWPRLALKSLPGGIVSSLHSFHKLPSVKVRRKDKKIIRNRSLRKNYC